MMAYNEELGVKDVCFIMDRGFCKTDNIQYMHSTGKAYICGGELGYKAASVALRAVRANIVSMRNAISQGVYASAIHSRFYGAKATLHIYFDPNRIERQRQDLYRKIAVEDEKLSKIEHLTKKEAKRYRNHFDIELADNGTFKYERNYDKIDEIAKNCGFFGILTNTDLNSEDILSAYRRKDVIEKGFDELKNHIDIKRLRTHNTTTTDGKMFCAFIALIAISKMANMLSVFMKSKSMSKDGLISELEKIKVVTMSDGTRLMNPITKTQRTIFEACNLSEDDLKAYVNGI
jgi:transposase